MYGSIGAGDIIDVYAGGHIDQNTHNFISERNNVMLSSVAGYARDFFNSAANLYQMVSSSDAIQMLRNINAKKEDVWMNEIHYIPTLERLQTAGPIMQRWIMAQPDLRQRYLNQEVSGYDDAYVNYHGEVYGERHYDYRRVMDGIVQVDDGDLRMVQWHEETPESDPELTLFQKVDILRTWNQVQHYLDLGDEDPTSPTGGTL